jgi:hypothetical protein
MAMLKKVNFCVKCKVEQDNQSGLKTCTRCSVAWYCSKECQKDDFGDHKSFCKNIKKQRDNVEKLDQGLRSCITWFENEHANMFETRMGHFWGTFTAEGEIQPRDYMRARYEILKILQIPNFYRKFMNILSIRDFSVKMQQTSQIKY